MTRKPRIGRPSHPAQARGKTAKALRKRKPVEQTPYHHGALHEALLKAAQTVLEREGLQGLTLRAVAREAGVSHAAPTHHFGDLTGLVSELAAVGFRPVNAAMAAAETTGPAPPHQGMARAK